MSALERESPGIHRLGVIAERAGLGASQTNKLLAQAEAHGLVHRAGYGRYELTVAARTAGDGGVPAGGADKLSGSPGRDLLLSVRDEAGGHVAALHLPRLLSAARLRCELVDMVCAPEQRTPAVGILAHREPTRTAAGRVLLAALHRLGHRAFPAPGRGTPLENVTSVRRSGLVHHSADGWDSLATALGHEGRVVGALSISGPSKQKPGIRHWADVLNRASFPLTRSG